MGCNCKKKLDLIDAKYGDGGVSNNKTNPLVKILEFILKFLFGILCGGIIIIMVIPMLIYIIICLMFGREAKIRLKNVNKYIKKID